MTPTLVALVIPVYRGWEHVERLIADLEPLPAWLSIHVVDDASGDRGGEVLLGAHPDIHLVTRVENGGFGASVNTGVANATSADVLVIVNSDLRITVETVRCLAQVAAEQHVIVGPHTVRLNHESVAVGHRFPTLWSYAQELFLVTRGIRNLRRRLSVNPQETGVVYVDWIIGSCLAFDRTLWERIGPIDEGFHMYSEEIDWQRRANALGIGSCWLPQLQVSHDEMHGAAMRVDSPERTSRFVMIWRSRLRYQRKHWSRTAGLSLRALWTLSLVVNAPILVPLSLVRWRGQSRARAELTRAIILFRGAISGDI